MAVYDAKFPLNSNCAESIVYRFFRAIKEKIANETEKMNYQQFKAYLKKIK